MNPIARMMKRYIKMPLKKALPLLFIGALVLVATCGCTTNTTTQNSSGGGGASGSSAIAVTVNSQYTASQIGSGYAVDTPQAGNEYLIFNVTVKNLNENNWDIGNPLYFKLTTADGTVYQYSSSSFDLTNPLNVVSGTNAGEHVTGQIAFEIPQGAKATTLTYNDDFNSVVTNLS
ncbi:MAG: DUF4352 domain-containing protein [Halobacteriota archaeon]